MTVKVFKFLSLLVTIVSTYTAWSFSRIYDERSPLHAVNFESSRTGLMPLKLPNEVLNAVVKIERFNEYGLKSGGCSAFSLSRDGHLMTAAHCVEQCLADADLFEKKGPISIVKREKLSEVSCKVKINGKDAFAKVLAIGDCSRAERARLAPCPRLDYALIQLSDHHPSSCFSLATEAPPYGLAVASVGYPKRTMRSQWRSDGRDSNGKEQFVSTGETMPPSAFCYKRVDQGSDERAGPRQLPPSFARRAMEGVEAKEYIQTKGADVIGGSSGGPLISLSTGAVVGISSFYLGNDHSEFSECEGATFYTATAPIIRAIRKDFPKVDLAAALNCANPIGPGN